jgi:hypothetical protein
MTDAQRAIIREQNAVLKRSEIDTLTVTLRLERQIEDLKRAAEREKREINARAIQRVRELGAEYDRLSPTVEARLLAVSTDQAGSAENCRAEAERTMRL